MVSKHLLTLICLGCLACPVWALSSDSEQPINIEADRATLDDARNRVTYQGSVVVTQGTMRIVADQVDLYYTGQRELEKAVAVGNPARYRQLPDGSQEYVKARSRTMEYLTSKNLLYLIDGAQVTRGSDSISGQRITYDVVKNRAIAEAGEAAKERVTVTIHPKKPGPVKPGRLP